MIFVLLLSQLVYAQSVFQVQVFEDDQCLKTVKETFEYSEDECYTRANLCDGKKDPPSECRYLTKENGIGYQCKGESSLSVTLYKDNACKMPIDTLVFQKSELTLSLGICLEGKKGLCTGTPLKEPVLLLSEHPQSVAELQKTASSSSSTKTVVAVSMLLLLLLF